MTDNWKEDPTIADAIASGEIKADEAMAISELVPDPPPPPPPEPSLDDDDIPDWFKEKGYGPKREKPDEM